MRSPAAKDRGQCEVREDRGNLPDLTPWREVGWIFRDGETIAIERQEERIRSRPISEESPNQSS
jgi:hypothetical protein